MDDKTRRIFDEMYPQLPRLLSDSERNQLRDLAHEADEPCGICGDMVSPMPTGPTTWEWPHGEWDGHGPLCEWCSSDIDRITKETP